MILDFTRVLYFITFIYVDNDNININATFYNDLFNFWYVFISNMEIYLILQIRLYKGNISECKSIIKHQKVWSVKIHQSFNIICIEQAKIFFKNRIFRYIEIVPVGPVVSELYSISQ